MSKMTISKGRMKTAMYTVTLACVLVLCAATLTGAARSGEWRGVVRSAACVQGPVVLLGEIADPAPGTDARTWRTVAGIKLWQASKKRGRPVTADRAKLRKVLKYYLGDQVENLVLPSQLTVQTGGSVLTGEELRSRVVAFLTLRARDFGGQVEIKDIRLPVNFFFKNDDDKLDIRLANDIRPGRNQVQLKAVSPDGRVMYSKAGTAFLNVWKAVPVAARPLNRMEHITKQKVSFRRVNLAYQPDLWDGKGGPWRMARTLGRGQPFTQSHLEPVPLIEKGERVTLVYKNSRIQLSIKAEALAEAGMGQQVSVRNLQSNKTVLATVVNSDTVMVR